VTLHDLAEHLGSSNLWAAAAVTEQRPDCEPTPAPRDPVELARWFETTSETLLKVLNVDPATSAWQHTWGRVAPRYPIA
jgi:hypothetical protein